MDSVTGRKLCGQKYIPSIPKNNTSSMSTFTEAINGPHPQKRKCITGAEEVRRRKVQKVQATMAAVSSRPTVPTKFKNAAGILFGPHARVRYGELQRPRSI